MRLLAGTLGFAGFTVDFATTGLATADFDTGFAMAGFTEVGFIDFGVEEDTGRLPV